MYDTPVRFFFLLKIYFIKYGVVINYAFIKLIFFTASYYENVNKIKSRRDLCVYENLIFEAPDDDNGAVKL